MRSHLRSGAALIIVLLILLALMVLGLPFLFSQSSGLAGARSFQASQAAHIYRQSAENLGLAIAAYTNEGAWKQTTGTDLTAQIHTALYLYLKDSPLLQASLIYENPNRLSINAAKLPDASGAFDAWNQPGEDVRIGVTISDESGKLDANTLSPQDWQNLFQQPEIAIPDWDDQQVNVTWASDEGPDSDTTGELADTLVHRRLGQGRYTRLEQLMEPDPQTYWRGAHTHPEFRKRLSRAEIERLRPYLSFHNPAPGRAGMVDLGSVIFTDALPGAPAPANLTPPNVWMDIPGNILADGQWIWAEDTPNAKPLHEGLLRVTNNGGFSINYAAGSMRPAADSAILWQAPPALNLHQISPLIRNLRAYQFADYDTDALLPLLPTDPVTFYGAQTTVTPITNALPTGFMHPWFHPNPIATNLPPRARQPLDLRSTGSIRIEAAATIRNHLGDLTAQESRTVIMQAVPQETTLERRWTTQGQFEPLIDQHLTSRMITWPNATARATDLVPADVDPQTATTSTLPTAETGISIEPNPSLASAALTLTHLPIGWRSTLGVNANRVAADAANDELRTPINAAGFALRGPPVTDATITPPPTAQTGGEGLFPDGMRIGGNGVLAYTFDQSQTGPLTWTSPVAPLIDGSLGSRQISFWFKPESDWFRNGTGTVVTLMEARASDDYLTVLSPDILSPTTTMAINTAGHTDRQNYFAVQYDPKQNMLVLMYAPPSAACTAPPIPWTALPDFPDIPGSYWDERCLPGGLSLVSQRCNKANIINWSETYQPNRIMTCYKLGRRIDTTGARVANAPETGRWYHLQVIIGDGRPGGLGLILDGIAGTDVGLMRAKDYVASRQGSDLKGPWPGDHLTFPSLILTQDLNAVSKPITSAAQAAALYPLAGIAVEMPGFSPFITNETSDYSSAPTVALTPLDTLPSRGTALIGDEYIRYEEIDPDTAATSAPYGYLLKSCSRGSRQNTWTSTDAGDVLRMAPTTENHRKGDRVLADGIRFSPDNGILYQGGSALTTAMIVGDTTTILPADLHFGAVTGLVTPPPLSVTFPATLAITGTSGFSNPQAPVNGYVRVEVNNSLKGYYHFTRAALYLTLTTVDTSLEKMPTFASVYGPMSSPASFLNSAGDPIRLILISQQITDSISNNPLAADSFCLGRGLQDETIFDVNNLRMFQLIEPTSGRCEWLRYTDIIRDSDGVYILNRNGWGFPDVRTNRQRGCQRTPPPTAGQSSGSTFVFPVGSLVLPVQPRSTFGSQAGLLSPGDLITLVPSNYKVDKAVAMIIRYAANDGYDGSQDELTDTVNEQFAFTAPLRGLIQPNATAGAYQVVMGSGLNSRLNLNPLNNLTQNTILSALPRLDAHESLNGAIKGRLLFGSQDVARGGLVNPSGSALMTIDAPAAGPWATTTGRLKAIFNLSGAPTTIAATQDLPVYIWTTDNIFNGSEPLCLIEFGGEVFAALAVNPTDDDAPLIAGINALRTTYTWLPDGAVYVPNHRACFARLVGRALLGSASSAHALTPSVANTELTLNQQSSHDYLAYGQEVMRLPVGPVRFLSDGTKLLPGGDNTYQMKSDEQTLSGSFSAPCALIAEPVRSAPEPWTAHQEILNQGAYDGRAQLSSYDPANPSTPFTWPNPNANRWLTAQWLRGLYNTDPTQPWADQPGGRGQLHPLVIGWWTRYPSALPKVIPATTAAQQLRCRHYPWAGFPLNLHGARFDNLHPPEISFDPTLAANKVLTEPNPNLQLEVRAMAGSIDGVTTVAGAIGDALGSSFSDWSQITPVSPSLAAGGWLPIANLFTWNSSGGPDTAKITTGVEVRVTFRYTGVTSGDLSDIARAANRAPLISGFKLRAHAPVATLAVEDAR